VSADLSLYELLSGDRARVHAVASAFYLKVMADDLLSPHFARTDMNVQAGMLADFLARALGGPGPDEAGDIRSAHARLHGLTDVHFDRVLGYLAGALRDFGMREEDVATASAMAETLRDDVLNR
jgi:hemoglobin